MKFKAIITQQKEFERLELLLTSDFDEMLNRFENLKKLNEEMDEGYYEKRNAEKKI